MAKMSRRQARERKREGRPQPAMQDQPEVPAPRRAEPLKAKNEKQRKYINAIKSSTCTIATGPAGTGKTYCAGAIAAEMLESKLIDKIIITRPAVEAGESLGFLPGEVEQKYEPYLAPFRGVLNERLGKGFVDYLVKHGRIEAAPLAYMRGCTFKNAVVILDEAQNCTPQQLKLFLTRVGENCKVIINGDEDQADISNSGLMDAVARLRWCGHVTHVAFTAEESVRSVFTAAVLQSYAGIRPTPLPGFL